MATPTQTTAEIVRKLGHYKKAVRELASRREKITKEYPDQWVALYHDGEGFRVFAAPSQERLLRQIDELGLDREVVATEFLNTKKRTLML